MSAERWKIEVYPEKTGLAVGVDKPGGQALRLFFSYQGFLRGTIRGHLGAEGLVVQLDWNPLQDIISGYSMAVGGLQHDDLLIRRYDPEHAVIYCDKPLPQSGLEGRNFTLHAPEAFLISMLRIITQTPLSEALPSVEMHLSKSSTETGTEPMLVLGVKSQSGVVEESPYLYVPVGAQDAISNDFPESEMNRVLREVYKYPGAPVLIALHRSHFTSEHEKNISNLLKTAGYKFRYLSHQPEQLLYPASLDFTRMSSYIKDLVNAYAGQVQHELGQGSFLIMDF